MSNVLVIVVDLNPVWWGQVSEQTDEHFTLTKCVEDIVVFANSHLLSCSHSLAILGFFANSSYFLYPSPNSDDATANLKLDNTNSGSTNNGIYDTLNYVADSVNERVKEILETGGLSSQCIVAGTLAMALCYIQRLRRECDSEDLSARILVVKGSEDDADQYMNLMNVVFSAQRQNVVIDACILGIDSSLLQQSCDITGGTYLRIPQLQGLLQYLLWMFLPSTGIREKLTLPPKVHVDYRAACFCHRKLIDIGYVCSVCLSIFCSFSPICSTCQSTFRLMTPTKSSKKKIKVKT